MTLTEALEVAVDLLDRDVYPSNQEPRPFVKYDTARDALETLRAEAERRKATGE